MNSRTERLLAALLLAAATAATAPASAQDTADPTEPAGPPEIKVTAVAETDPVPGDATDAAIWVHPSIPEMSLVLGTDRTHGLLVYDVAGNEIADYPDGRLDDIDTRPFRLGLEDVTLAGATKRDDDTLVFYAIDTDGEMRRVGGGPYPAMPPGAEAETDDVHAFTMADIDGTVFAIASFDSGQVFQWLVENNGGLLTLLLAREWTVPGPAASMAADDANGFLYVSDGETGILRYPLDPGLPAEATTVDSIGEACLPEADVAGLALAGTPDEGYLLASARESDRIAVYPRKPDADGSQPCLALVETAAGRRIDGVSQTVGLDVATVPLGDDYPEGLVVLMDDINAGFTTNFKLLSWKDIAKELATE